MNALEELLTYPRFGASGVFERMEALTKSLEMVPAIKVVGSNGKGSTAHMMAQMALDLGKKVGLYTSPHLLRVGERIQVNGREIVMRDLNYILKWAMDQAKGIEGVGRFEILTLAALYHFAQSGVDVAIMEVGLGGRFDPVRIAPGKYSVLTSVDLEHTAILGETLKEIATEKAAICKQGETLISAVGGMDDCMADGVCLKDVSAPPLSVEQSNARLAATALKHHFSLDHLPEALNLRLAGRMHLVCKEPLIYIDVAHSPKAVQSVLDKVGEKPITLIIAARNDKDIKHMPGEYEHVIALQLDEGMYETEQILEAFSATKKEKADTIAEAVALAKTNVAEEGVILCLGGFGLAGRMLAHMQGAHYDVISL